MFVNEDVKYFGNAVARSWRSQRGGGVQTPSIEKGVQFYCLVIEQKQWLIIKIVATMSYFEAKMHQISILAGAPPQTPLGELTALLQTS